MRLITKESVTFFLNGLKYRKSNTSVEDWPNVTVLKVFYNEIAYLYNDPEKTLYITNCGYFNNTIKERLNAIPGVEIFQKKGIWHLNGKQWNGDLIEINKN